MAKFVERDQSQLYLLPVDMRDWVPEDDLAHFVMAAVDRVPMSAFVVNERGTGSAQYHPRMMLALLVYCYANGIFGSRRIERATYRDIGVRYVASNCHPDHDTICMFRRNNFEAIAKAFEQVLLLANIVGGCTRSCRDRNSTIRYGAGMHRGERPSSYWSLEPVANVVQGRLRTCKW